MNRVSKKVPSSDRGPACSILHRSRALTKNICFEIAKKTALINKQPVIVLGVQKSGTTAVAALLGKATGAKVSIDFIHHATMEYRRRLFDRQLSFGRFVKDNRYYFARRIIKDPDLTFFVDDLLAHFPRGRFVFVVRDPRDCIRSILNRVILSGRLTAVDYSHWDTFVNGRNWQMIVEGRWPLVPGYTHIEKLAHRWNLGAEMYLQHHDKMSLLRYEQFVQDKAGCISTLANVAGLAPVHSIAEYVDFQFQPRGNPRVCLREFFGADNLQVIETVCGRNMERFGYGRQSEGAKGVNTSTASSGTFDRRHE